MTNSRRRRGPRRSLRLVETLDVLDLRASSLWGTALGVSLLGALVAWQVPGLLPPLPLVGATVAVAAILLGVAVTLVTDSMDRRVRGPRHVRAAGAELVAVLPTDAHPDIVGDLAVAVLDARHDGEPLRLGLAAAGPGVAGVGPWADALGIALADHGASVLVVDIASGSTTRDGLAEIALGRRRLSEVARIADGLRLARVGPGRDPEAALDGLGKLNAALPRDLEVMIVALPPVVSRGAVGATRYVDHLLVVGERDTTTRVELISALDAVGRVRSPAQVVLLDGVTASALGMVASVDIEEAPRRGARHDYRPDEEVFTGRIPRVTVPESDPYSTGEYEPYELREPDPSQSRPRPSAPAQPDVSAPIPPVAPTPPTPPVPPRDERASAVEPDPTGELDPSEIDPPRGFPGSGPPIVGGRPDLAPRGVAVQQAPSIAEDPPSLDDWVDDAPGPVGNVEPPAGSDGASAPAVADTPVRADSTVEADPTPVPSLDEWIEDTGVIPEETPTPTEHVPDERESTAPHDAEPRTPFEAVEPRDVDVMLGAAAAEAAMVSEAEAQPWQPENDTAQLERQVDATDPFATDRNYDEPFGSSVPTESLGLDEASTADAPPAPAIPDEGTRTHDELARLEARVDAELTGHATPEASSARQPPTVPSTPPAPQPADDGPFFGDPKRASFDPSTPGFDDLADASEDEDDLLRTTAQLAILADDLMDRDEQ